VRRVAIFPDALAIDREHSCRGETVRLTRRGAFDPGAEIIIRLCGPIREATYAAGFWDGSLDIAEARELIERHFPEMDLSTWWGRARDLVIRERGLIRRIAGALSRPAYELDEPALIRLASGADLASPPRLNR
jgi:hypothetical protein